MTAGFISVEPYVGITIHTAEGDPDDLPSPGFRCLKKILIPRSSPVFIRIASDIVRVRDQHFFRTSHRPGKEFILHSPVIAVEPEEPFAVQ